MTTRPDRLSEIARSLNRREWLPTVEEVELGSAFFQQAKAMEEQHPDFPPGPERGDRLHVENLTVLARFVENAHDELVPQRRDRLPASPMIELVELYISGAQPLLLHAKRMRAAWHSATLPEPATHEIAREAWRLSVTQQQAEANLRYWNAVGWEEEHDPYARWDNPHPAWARLATIGSTMMAAVTGDVDY
ncbi:hypothetical protein [Streptomyces boncukensis]|uniref:Uncharacterized protein n=1 Tax=Streptomyces boncukensis TaxID=2711219 RepID=A0A6G4WP89_9ACTN|nr:hypothetical protein [Streptomyces boncukensis]NGO67079.1 hypothetical protein [Streptomyces boncukensis]